MGQIFVCLVERSDVVIVMDPRNGAQMVSAVQRLSWRCVYFLGDQSQMNQPRTEFQSVCLRNWGCRGETWDVPRPKAPEVESRRV